MQRLITPASGTSRQHIPRAKMHPDDASAIDSADVGDAAIRPVDQLVLDLLRKEPGLTVTDLVDRLEVTATAVRLRTDRLEQMALIRRGKRPTSRGRPVFEYSLTDAGWRHVGVNYRELAVAMWEAIHSVPDEATRRAVVGAVAKRMGEAYAERLPVGPTPQRLEAMVGLLREQKIPARLDLESLTLEVQACPFPDLSDDEQHGICELEREALSVAVGLPMHLTCCRSDGGHCCQYRIAADVVTQ